MKSRKCKIYLQILIVILLLAWYGFFLTQKIDLTRVDLGRHIKNGEIILNGDFQVLKTNFYSYTYPDFPFLNHHWLTGIIFYLIFKIIGFGGLHLAFIILSLITFFIFFRLAEKESNTPTAAILSLALIPLMAYRVEIRPEIFTYLFAAIFFWVLWRWREGKILARLLFILPFLEILWVNLHIYFFLGPAIIGAFLVEKIILKKPIKTLSFVFASSLIATLVNPAGLSGAIHPFGIYKNYGYPILEEKSIWFLENLNVNNPNFLLFKIALFLLILSFVLLLIKNRQKFSLVGLFLAAGVGFLAWQAVRNLTLFGLFALPILAYNIKNSWPKIELGKLFNKLGPIILGLIVFLLSVIHYYQILVPLRHNFGLGLMSRNSLSAEFFKKEKIQGPIFNNYDVGGYLIYHLWPEERVFVDNRPETYPTSFFQNIYIPMQENDEVWRETNQKYNFNAIFFSYHDLTPWGQKFMISRVNDPDWAPVFVDGYSLIFLKRNEANKEIIEKYEIPREAFEIRRK